MYEFINKMVEMDPKLFAKNTTNSNSFDDLVVDNDLSVGGDITCDGTITSSNIPNYSHGTWTPEIAFISNGFKDYPAYSLDMDVQDGYYVKVGRNVTVWFQVTFTVTDSYRFDLGYKAVAITSLPFIFNNPDTPIPLEVKSPLTVGEWPNGLAGDYTPAIASPTYPKPYDIICFEEGRVVNLKMFNVATVDKGSWTADGYTAIVYSQSVTYTVSATIPPWSAVAQSYTQLSNFNVLLGSSYPVAFTGTFSYITEE